ncbi:MAG: 2-hydroxyacid dehydrogenase [Gammaproteobacteria bacterium]|nr:2-hydroxyacid dehydrogenase [Gammaproteobacteria bacterium]MCH9743993.1 2-hydroxyacid dehydrogenase [Gammaproteobacteria bacterium]
MKIAVFSAHVYEEPFFLDANHGQHQLTFLNDTLTEKTVAQANGFDAVCCFVMDTLNKTVLTQLKQQGIKLIALRSAGYDHVDLLTAKNLNLTVVRVPSYSPASIAEFTLGMLLALSRKLINAHDRIQQHNFSLEGLIGFNLNGKTAGIIGTGKIGSQVAQLLLAFGCTVLAYDIEVNEACQSNGVTYVGLETLYEKSDIISLHCPSTPTTKHIINAETLKKLKPHVIIINTGRGDLVDTAALIDALEEQRIGAAGLDVYEHESGLFFEDHSNQKIKDDLFIRLQSFPNVFITGHQAYFTQEALTNIANTTIDNITSFEKDIIKNSVTI